MTLVTGSVDSDEVELTIIDTGRRVRFHTGYTYQKDFLAPCDVWQFTTGDAAVIAALRAEVFPGTRVRLFINDRPQSTGFVDSLTISSSRSGNVATVKGRDTMGIAVDACVDPTLNFGPRSTLLDVLTKTFVPLGFRVFSTTDMVNREVVSGFDPKTTRVGVKTSKVLLSQPLVVDGKGNVTEQASQTVSTVPVTNRYDPTKPKFLKDFKLDQLKPNIGEGTYEFAARLCKRFRLHLWVDAFGETVVVSEPDFAQAPSYMLHSGNIVDGELSADWTQQPSVIIGVGRGGGGNFARSKLIVAQVNELTGCDTDGNILPDVRAAIGKYQGVVVLPLRPQLFQYASRFVNHFARPAYFEDTESQTIGQLEGRVRNEMATRQGRALTLSYDVKGHTHAGNPWALNTIVDVRDERLGINAPMWIKARQFTKSMSGTTTKLTLAIPYTVEL